MSDIVGNVGANVTFGGSFVDPGALSFAFIANFGDSSSETMNLGSGETFTVQHVFNAESTYTVSLTVVDNFGGSATISLLDHVLIDQVSVVDVSKAAPGQTTTSMAANGGSSISATLFHSGAANQSASLLVAVIPPNVADAFPNVFSVSTLAESYSYDVRAFNVSDTDQASVTFTYPAGGYSNPVLTDFDIGSASIEDSQGSEIVPNSYTINPTDHTLTVVFDRTSTPRLQDLNGTLFTISVDLTPLPVTRTPFFVTDPASVLAGERSSTTSSESLPTKIVSSASSFLSILVSSEGMALTATGPSFLIFNPSANSSGIQQNLIGAGLAPAQNGVTQDRATPHDLLRSALETLPPAPTTANFLPGVTISPSEPYFPPSEDKPISPTPLGTAQPSANDSDDAAGDGYWENFEETILSEQRLTQLPQGAAEGTPGESPLGTLLTSALGLAFIAAARPAPPRRRLELVPLCH